MISAMYLVLVPIGSPLGYYLEVDAAVGEVPIYATMPAIDEYGIGDLYVE